MITVWNVHGGGLGFGKERMDDDTELEEGEAGTYTEETEHHIDPDVAFAYIGEKLHDLLGHHQKEFEGCLTADNLGPKFGAYGSFLPTIKRSPSSMHPMMPQVQVPHNLPKTAAGSRGDSDCFTIQSTACQNTQHELGSASVSKLPSVLPTAHDSAKTDASSKPTHISELNTKLEDVKQLPCNKNDSVKKDANVNSFPEEGINTKSGDSEQLNKLVGRKPIRVRITMNSKKLLLLNNAPTICSPGLSANLLVSNSTKGKGLPLDSQDSLEKSPNAILRSMTAAVVPRSSILSPLPEYLTLLNINEKEHKDTKNIRPDSKCIEKTLKHKKKKPHPKVCEYAEESDRVLQSTITGSLNEVNGKSDLDVCDKEQPDFGISQLTGTVSVKQKRAHIKSLDISYRDSVGDEARGPAKDGMHSAGLSVNTKPALHVQDADKPSSRVPDVGKRSEGCSFQYVSLHRPSNRIHIVGSSVKPGKMRRMSGLNNDFKSENMNLQRGLEKTKDTYKDIFGDLSTDDEDNSSVYPELSSDSMNKKLEMVSHKTIAVPMHKAQIKESCEKDNDYVAVDEYTATGSSISVPMDHRHADISTTAAPIPILENWVFCDYCNKWRLLPLNVDPDSLPDKWMCKMITWLPGMNSCEISEEETTQAVHALYEPIVLENHLRVDAGSHGISSGNCPTEPPRQPFSSISALLTIKKKKHGSTKMSKSASFQCASKLQQSKAGDPFTEKNTVKMPKFFPEEEKYKKTEKRRDGHHCSSRVIDVLPVGNIKAEQDQLIYKEYLPRMHSKTNKKLLQVSAKRPKAKLRVSSDGSSLEMQKVDGYHVVNNKRKVRECSESEQLAQINQASHGSLSQDDQKRKKRMRLNQSGLNDLLSSECNGIPYEKVGDVNYHKSAKGQGTDRSKLNMHAAHPGKKNLGSLKNIAPESSSSKIHSSHKYKVDLESVKTSPVGSVSSLPLYRPKKDKHTKRKGSSLRHDDLVDKSLHKKLEDERLRSADKSNTSCTISGSKEDVSSGQKRKDKKSKVLVNNAVRSCKKENDANMSPRSSTCNELDKFVGDEAKSDLFSFEQPLSNQMPDRGSQCWLLAENIQLDSTSGTDRLPYGAVFNGRDDNKICSSQDAPESQHLHAVSTDATNDKIVEESCLVMKSGNQIEIQLNCTTPQTTDGCRTKDFVERNISTIKTDLLNDATFVEKEARNLKYMADRFGESGSACEKVGIYFQSSLKFLNAASLYESRTRLDDRKHAIQIYRSTTKLFEFCGTEFEKLNNMCAVALAYKCMEVACLRVAYSSYNSASKDLLELQNAVPPGESPSSCFSDVNNLKNMAPAEQASSTKGVTSPLAIDGLTIPTQNRPKLVQLVTFTEDVDMAMGSSQKSLTAFLAAYANSVNSQCISLVKKALDFSFQDIDEFLSLVRIAMEAISC